MITTPLKRGSKCYWKQHGSFSTAYFLSLNPMPIAPHAVKIKHGGDEVIVRDFEVFTERQRFENEYEIEIGYIQSLDDKKRGYKKYASEELEVPYSRILMVCKRAKELGIGLV